MSTNESKVFVKSYGCQMNVYDAERMVDVLAPEGFAATEAPSDADVVILNTCHIREKAVEKVYSELGRVRVMKDQRAAEGKETLVVVAGCVAQAEGAEIQRRMPLVDLVVGPQNYHRLPDLLAKARKGPVADTEFPVDSKFDHLPAPTSAAMKARGVSAFVTIQEGCDKFCAFCVVPYTRGAETSRPVDRVLSDIRRLAAAGVREITLIGQNVNAYHGVDGGGREVGLARLLAEVAAVEGILRIRYTTSHPNDMDDELIAAHRNIPQLMPYLHLPVQSGSDGILKVMNRKHDARTYRNIVEKVRAARPDIALSSDFIVGFPGETDADFNDTLALVDEIGFASAFSFKYSQRPGTPAADAPAQVPETVKAERLARLQERLEHHRQAFNTRLVGRVLPVLIEREGRHPGQLVGKSPYLQGVHFDAAGSGLTIGDVAQVEIVGTGPNSLSGRLVDQTAHAA